MGSRKASIPFTASNGRLSDDSPVAGSVTLNPSRVMGVWYARAPPSGMRPSAPRMTDGRSGSDSRACMCADGRRATVAAVSVLPRRAAVGDDSTDAGARTVMVSDAWAIVSTMRLASARATRCGSKPSSEATTTSPIGSRRSQTIRSRR